MHRIALLIGILGAPGILIAMGHHLRRRSTNTKHLFWGGVIGHTIGMMTTVVAMVSPSVSWTDGSQLRTLLVHWSMVAGLAVGMALAALFWRTPPDQPATRAR